MFDWMFPGILAAGVSSGWIPLGVCSGVETSGASGEASDEASGEEGRGWNGAGVGVHVSIRAGGRPSRVSNLIVLKLNDT